MTTAPGNGQPPRIRRVYLMRHGDVEYYTREALQMHPDKRTLTARGREQAAAAGQLLAEVPFDRVVTSGLPRTVDTARIVLNQSVTTPPEDFEVCTGLLEIRGGPVLAVPADQLEQEFLGIWLGVATPDSSFLLGEPVATLVDRVTRSFEALLDEPGWETMLLVGHGAVNRAILSWALTDQPVFLGHLEQGTACVNVIDVAPLGTPRAATPRGLGVRAINLTPYDLLHEGARLSDIYRMYAQYQEAVVQPGSPDAAQRAAVEVTSCPCPSEEIR